MLSSHDEFTEQIVGHVCIGHAIGNDGGQAGQAPACGCIASAIAGILTIASTAIVLGSPLTNITCPLSERAGFECSELHAIRRLFSDSQSRRVLPQLS